MKIYDANGKEIPFAQYLDEMGGSGFVYEDDIEQMLLKWETEDWIYANSYIAPIATEILTESAEVNREIYANLMRVIVESYQIMKRNEGLRPQLTRIK